LSTFLDLDSNIRVVLKILCKPNCAEMAPSKLLNNHVPVKENFTYVDRMIASDLVIRHTLIFT
jgi:hypothetical protein